MQASLSEELINWVSQELNSKVESCEAVHGGDTSTTCRITTASQKVLFAKLVEQSESALLQSEANNLRLIATRVDGVVPAIINQTEQLLLLEWLEPCVDETSGQALARVVLKLHQVVGETFGLAYDNHCGATPQPNTQTSNGIEFFAEHRLMYQARRAYDAKRLSQQGVRQVERISQRLADWLPAQPPVLIHGDLWSGNALYTQYGARLVDPACYYGWREADIAMTYLFGGFTSEFYSDYFAVHPFEPEYNQRIPLYNLYHLLNHLNLFGEHYLTSVQVILDRYC